MNAESKPLFSIITAAYNSASTIDSTIASLQNQTFRDFEWIVIDGGSSDATVAKVRSVDDLCVVVHSGPDEGIYDAMNQGIKLARGRYFGFLNSDDSYLPETLAAVAKILQTRNLPEPPIIYADMHTVRQAGSETFERREYARLDQLEAGMYIFHPAIWIPRVYFETLGNYDLRFKLAADYHWVLRAKMVGKPFHYLPESLARFSVGGKSSQSCESYREAAEIQAELGSEHSAATSVLYAVCRRKAPLRKLKAFLAQLPVLNHIHRSILKRKWS